MTSRFSKRKTLLALATALTASALSLSFSTTAFAQNPIIIKFSHVVAADTPKGKSAERFKELAE